MQVNIKGGSTTVKLTQQEQRTLRAAQEICNSLDKLSDSDGPAVARDGLEEVIKEYCDKVEAGK